MCLKIFLFRRLLWNPRQYGQWALYCSQDKPCPLYQKDGWYTWWLYY